MTAVKVWTGSAWADSQVTEKAWDGSAWVEFSPGGAPSPESMFGATVPPNGATDGIALTQGTRFSSDVPGTVTDIKWYFKSGSLPASASGAFYRYSDKVQLHSPVSFSVAAGWVTAALTSPVHITAGVDYMTVGWTPSFYVYQSSPGFPISNGSHLTAKGCQFDGSSSATFPNNASSLNFWCDVVFVPD